MVKVISSTLELIQERQNDKIVGFVPTMGNLHKGHISLLNQALSDFKNVYFSIFVNPKQFGPNEDFNRYPRTLEQDINLIKECANHFPNSKVVVFAPSSPHEVFPETNGSKISVWRLSTILEGKIRPGHFDGVTTVVYRLFDLIKPHTAYFGLKDYQQYLVIKEMIKDLNLPICIKGMPIVREESGLALSSRNQYLSDEQKKASLILFNTLKKIVEIIDSKKLNLNNAKKYIDTVLTDQNWNYLEIRDSETLSDDTINSKNISILAVYQLGATRLLDNMQVEIK